MTGTADTESVEFKEIYNLDVVVDPDQPADDPRSTITTSFTRPRTKSSTR